MMFLEAYRMQTPKFIIFTSIILTIIIISLFIYFFVIPPKVETEKVNIRGIEQKSIKEHTGPVSTKNEPTAIESFDLPPLHDSDNFLREHLKKCSNHPEYLSWLKIDDIIRRFVATVDNIANGENPGANLKFLEPRGEFQITKLNNQLTNDPQNYARFNTMVNIFCSIKNEVFISLYQKFKPLVNQAYRELGYPGKDFEATLIQAIQVIQSTPVIPSPVYLEKKVITYAFKDPKIEALSPIQKQILGTGPENVQKIKQKMEKIKNLLKFQAPED